VTSCPFCDCTDIVRKQDVIFKESDIKGVRETCENCSYTQFIANKGEKE